MSLSSAPRAPLKNCCCCSPCAKRPGPCSSSPSSSSSVPYANRSLLMLLSSLSSPGFRWLMLKTCSATAVCRLPRLPCATTLWTIPPAYDALSVQSTQKKKKKQRECEEPTTAAPHLPHIKLNKEEKGGAGAGGVTQATASRHTRHGLTRAFIRVGETRTAVAAACPSTAKMGHRGSPGSGVTCRPARSRSSIERRLGLDPSGSCCSATRCCPCVSGRVPPFSKGTLGLRSTKT